jgi:hypothetical protein
MVAWVPGFLRLLPILWPLTVVEVSMTLFRNSKSDQNLNVPDCQRRIDACFSEGRYEYSLVICWIVGVGNRIHQTLSGQTKLALNDCSYVPPRSQNCSYKLRPECHRLGVENILMWLVSNRARLASITLSAATPPRHRPTWRSAAHRKHSSGL